MEGNWEGLQNGLLSTDILIAESAATPEGFSLQLLGVGISYADFSWSGAAPNSFGGINAGQTFVPIPASLLLLSSGLLGMGALGWKQRKKE